MVDGSRRVTLRNRRFLRPILTSCRKSEIATGPPPIQLQPAVDESNVPQIANTPYDQSSTEIPQRTIVQEELQDIQTVRRSTREKRAPRPLSPKMSGQSHD